MKRRRTTLDRPRKGEARMDPERMEFFLRYGGNWDYGNDQMTRRNEILDRYQRILNGDPGRIRRFTLEGVDLEGTNLKGANLRYCNLTNADLRGANLKRADLTNAYIARTDFRYADLTEANLSEAHTNYVTIGGGCPFPRFDGATVRKTNLSLSGRDLVYTWGLEKAKKKKKAYAEGRKKLLLEYMLREGEQYQVSPKSR